MKKDENNNTAIELVKRLIEHDDNSSIFDEYANDGQMVDVWASSTLRQILIDCKNFVKTITITIIFLSNIYRWDYTWPKYKARHPYIRPRMYATDFKQGAPVETFLLNS
jgi:hypothetical protein